jgi:ferredoxin--NADP+ reductase
MFTITEKKELAPQVHLFKIKAPLIAAKISPGQYVILRLDENGERFPLTVVDADINEGIITLISQTVGKSTAHLASLNIGDAILDIAGPLGHPTEIKNYGKVVIIGGGVGIAEIYPVAQALKYAGNKIISILGGRSKNLIILEDEIKKVSDQVYITTDDGSYEKKGLVTDVLKRLVTTPSPPLEKGDKGGFINLVYAVGPTIMMKAVAEVTKPAKIKTRVSLNPIFLDATGMCGVCRVTVSGSTKFACVDGPDFDAHEVDFDELMKRQRIYLEEEKLALEKFRARA